MHGFTRKQRAKRDFPRAGRSGPWLAGSLLALGLLAAPVGANSYTVNTLADDTTGGDGSCTLREAILAANNAPANGDCGAGSSANDTITFSVSGTITLGSTLPNIVSGQGTLTIDGGGSITISGGGSVRVMVVDSGADLTLQNLTISNGNAGSGSGGGVENNGTLTITNSTFSGNRATFGGGVNNASGAMLHLANTIIANSPMGGDCVGSLTGANLNNLIEDSTNACGLVNASLGALTGWPAYFPLNPGSPAIDAGDNTTCQNPPVNNQSQNGVTRPQDGDGNTVAVCDIGSFEAPAVAPVTRTLTITKTGTGSGTVTSSPAGITCGATCTASYASSTVVTLTATPDPGSTFAGWSGDSDCTDGSVTMDADKTCTATFTLNQYTISFSVNPPGAGSVTCTPNPGPHGSSTTCTITPNPGYSLQSVTGCGGTLSGSTYTIPSVTGACTVNVTFQQQQVEAIPTLEEWGLVTLITLLAASGVVLLRRLWA